MERAVVVGNCQAPALEMMLNTNRAFTDRFAFVTFPPVHEIPAAMVPELHRAVADATLVITQRVDEDYRDGVGLGTETIATIAARAEVIRWPSVYWAGYFPDLFYLRDSGGQVVSDGPFDYHDQTILRAFNSGIDVAGVCRLLQDPDRPSDAEAWAAHATAELDIRGRDCDIDVGPYIASAFRDELLFATMNHPTNRLLGVIAQQITALIGLPGRVGPQRLAEEVLGSTFYPLHANHVRALELKFGAQHGAGRTPYKIRGVTYEPHEAVQAFFDYYVANPQLVKLNLQSDAT